MVGIVGRRLVLHGSTAGHGRQEHAVVWTAGARISEVEEAGRPLDVNNPMVTDDRIVC